MNRQYVTRNHQQKKNASSLTSGILQRTAVSSLPENKVELNQNQKEKSTHYEGSGFHQDFTRIPLHSKRESVTQAQGLIADNLTSEEQRPNKTGLPESIKIGIENLSGYSMDDVRVHYNSDKPGQLQANAYAQGTDIHLASGQEKNLPHEAWHVVQQKQGRVKPTLQTKGVRINDDKGLEKEADIMGLNASQNKSQEDENHDSNQHSTSLIAQKKETTTTLSNVIQKNSKLTNIKSDGPYDPPFTILERELPGVKLFLSSTNANDSNNPSSLQSQYERPVEVTAEIIGSRRQVGTRVSNNITSVIGNFGNQELLIRKGTRSQTFQGGHLIGDQLLNKGINSMVDWNLAPQNLDFNHPVYFGLAEELIFQGVVNPNTNRII